MLRVGRKTRASTLRSKSPVFQPQKRKKWEEGRGGKEREMTLFGAKDRCSHGTFFEHSKYPLLYLLTAWCYLQSLLAITEVLLEEQSNSRSVGDLSVGRGGQQELGEEGGFLQNFGDI